MHILWVPSWYPTPDFPLNGSFFKEQVQMLRRAGCKVGVCYLAVKSFWQKRDSLRIDTSDQLFEKEIPTIPLGLLPGDALIIRKNALKLAKLYEEKWGKPDIIHAHSAFPGVIAAQAMANYWGVPYGVTEHRPSSLERSLKHPRGEYIKRAVCEANFRASVSAPFSELLARKYGCDFSVIALPVRDDFFKQMNIYPESPRFLHISNLDSNKRTQETITAFADVARELPDAHFDIVGGDQVRITELKQHCESLGIEKAVTFLGQKPRAEISSVYLGHTAFILASALEAGGTVLAEAQCLGVPVIATQTFAGRFMVHPETGINVPIDDWAALSSAMIEIAKNPDRFSPKRIQEIAYERFSEKTFTEESISLYEQALSA